MLAAAPLALGLAGAEDEDGLAVLCTTTSRMNLFDGLDLEPLGTPAKLLAWGRVAAADEVDPERVFDLGSELLRREGHALLGSGSLHALQGVAHPGGEGTMILPLCRNAVVGTHAPCIQPMTGKELTDLGDSPGPQGPSTIAQRRRHAGGHEVLPTSSAS